MDFLRDHLLGLDKRRFLTRGRSYLVITGFATVLLALFSGTLALRRIALHAAEKNLMILHKNGTQRPDDFGADSEMVWFQSGNRSLQASIVHASSSCDSRVAVLVFHGRGETISDWAKAQAFLSQQCISSMAFDYSGHGSSAPPAHISTLNADALAAYVNFVLRFPSPGRRCILGHSMGVAPMLHAYPSLQPPPDCTVAANGFSSLEDFARSGGAPVPIAALLSSIWNNMRAVKAVHGSLLVIHSDADEVIAPTMARRLDVAAPATALLLTTHGFAHNAIYAAPNLSSWGPIITFLR